MSWDGVDIESKQESIERTLESKTRDVESYEQRITELGEKLQAIEAALDSLSRDNALQQSLGDVKAEREQERLESEREAQSMQEDLEYLLRLVTEGEEASDRDADAIESLREIGEDVSDAERILAERRAWAEETRAMINDLIERLGGRVSEPMTRITASRRLSDNIDTSNQANSADFGDRYISPGTAIIDRFQNLVKTYGPTNPAFWIDAGNPLYDTHQNEWAMNCGSCARSFADTFQGKSMMPALGDTNDPPGEGKEMWDILGTRPSRGMTNMHAEPARFVESAYQALHATLQREGIGAVAIIGVDWEPREKGEGHWFNAYVDKDGTVKWADLQLGVTGDWPPDYATDIWHMEAVVRTSADAPWKELVL